ncbi:MAG: hypothetical protein PHI27_06540 [Eubacteriales bacterium]|nr:hypothetical protein [Eubacteriales bacterium]MDD4513731.1 hypothetical protein [Eubacteriales bacterium]
MKTCPQSKNIAQITTQEPRCYIAWYPTRPDQTERQENDPVSTCPSILIMPNMSKGKFMEEKRFDRYNNVHRPKELGQSLAVSMLFSVYEPGVRLPGFVDSVENGGGYDMTKIEEGTEQGVFTLLNWMDDAIEKLLRDQFIPKSDLFIDEESICYSLYTDQSYVVDKRPIYYGFVNCEFNCYANDGANSSINNILK